MKSSPRLPRFARSIAFGLAVFLPSAARAVDCNNVRYRGAEYLVCVVDTKTDDLKLYWKRPDGTRIGTIQKLRDELKAGNQELEFATNAGIFSPGFTPLGLYVEAGHEKVALNTANGSGNFFLKPNGVFLLTASGPQIVESSKFRDLALTPTLATQSGPLLVENGSIHPAFNLESVNKTVRSGVGVSGARALFAISRTDVSFYDFAALFRDQLRCASALYLDGAISTIFVRGEPEEKMTEEFAGIIAIAAELKK